MKSVKFIIFGLKSLVLSFIKKKKKKKHAEIDIRNYKYEPKNAIKMKNIQTFNSVHIGSIWPILFSSVQFGPIQSYLAHSVH